MTTIERIEQPTQGLSPNSISLSTLTHRHLIVQTPKFKVAISNSGALFFTVWARMGWCYNNIIRGFSINSNFAIEDCEFLRIFVDYTVKHEYQRRFYQCFTASCTVPVEPTNGTITATLVDGTTVDYDSLNDPVLEGTVLTYQCDNGLTLFGSVNITCMGDGEWSSDPDTNICSGKCKYMQL